MFHRTEQVLLADGHLVPVGVVSASLHVGDTRDAVIALKYGNERPVARMLGELIAPFLGEEEIITWVPTSARRAQVRGIDHAEHIARYAAASRGRSAVRLLRRVGESQQTGRSRSQRLVAPRFVAHDKVHGCRVVIVDDVVTTGATVRAAAGALLVAGAESVRCVSVCTVR